MSAIGASKALSGNCLLLVNRRPSASRLFQKTRHRNDDGNGDKDGSIIGAQSTKKSTRHANVRVREIVQVLVLSTKDESPSSTSTSSSSSNWGSEWSKTRNYLYNSRSDLTVDQVKKVLCFLEDVLAGDKNLVCSVIQTNPRILRKSVDNYLKPTAAFLIDLYGTELLCEAVRRNPAILLSRGVGSDATQDAISATENYLTSNMGLKQSDLAKLREKAPWLFQRSTDQIESVVGFWENILQSSGKTSLARHAILGKLMKTYPTLFNLSVEQGLIPKVAFLEEQCGLTREDVASLLMGSRAALFCLSVPDNLQPTLELLLELMPGTTTGDEGEDAHEEAKRDQIRKCVLKHPQILCLSQKNLKEKISYFDAIDASRTTKKKEPLASRVAIRSPVVYSLSLKENIIPKVAFLSGVWGKYAPEVIWQEGKLVINESPEERMKAERNEGESSSLAGLLGEYPSILTLSLEGNIQPTLNFYNRTGFIRLDPHWKMANTTSHWEEADSTISPVPVIRARYIASSLFQRLLPRWHFYQLNKEKFSNTTKKKGIHSLSLHLLSVANDMDFCDYVGVDVDDFKVFKEDAVPRLKFSSQFDTWIKTGKPIDV